MWLEYDWYFQGRFNADTHTNKLKDLVDMCSYTDPIMIVIEFCRGLNAMTQDKITESGTYRP
jgi:hypothetical protein